MSQCLQRYGITVRHIGQSYYHGFWDVVISAPVSLGFPCQCDQFTLEEMNPTKPTVSERRINSDAVAQDRFFQNALSTSPYPSISRRLYRQIAAENNVERVLFALDFEVISLERQCQQDTESSRILLSRSG